MSPAAGNRVQVPALPTGSTRLQLPLPLVAFWRCVDRNPPPVEQGESFSASLAHRHGPAMGPPAEPWGRLEGWGRLCGLFSTSRAGSEPDHKFFPVSLVKSDVMATAVLLHETSRNIIWVPRDL